MDDLDKARAVFERLREEQDQRRARKLREALDNVGRVRLGGDERAASPTP